MANHFLGNRQLTSLAAGQWRGDSVIFFGTSTAPGVDPTVTFTGSDTLGPVTVIGTAQASDYGAISLSPGVAVTVGGVGLSYGTLGVSERANASLTLTGTSNITHGSAMTVTAYSGIGQFGLNGVMNIDGTSTVNLDYMPVSGPGTFHLTGKSALLRLGQASADTTVNLDGGVLSLRDGMHFLGTITDSSPAAGAISPSAEVDVYNAMDAVRETFNTRTGMLDLFNAQGGEVANLHFAGTGPLYAFKTSGLATDHIIISENPSLPPSTTRLPN